MILLHTSPVEFPCGQRHHSRIVPEKLRMHHFFKFGRTSRNDMQLKHHRDREARKRNLLAMLAGRAMRWRAADGIESAIRSDALRTVRGHEAAMVKGVGAGTLKPPFTQSLHWSLTKDWSVVEVAVQLAWSRPPQVPRARLRSACRSIVAPMSRRGDNLEFVGRRWSRRAERSQADRRHRPLQGAADGTNLRPWVDQFGS